MKEKLESLKNLILNKIKEATELSDIEEIKNLYLSKKGEIANLMKNLRDLSPEDRPEFGKNVNELKEIIEKSLYLRKAILEDIKLEYILKQEKLDITLPGYSFYKGSIHPLNQVIEEVEDFFIGLGYEIEDGPELESDYFNFEMMNLSKDHPARAMQDSFYVDENYLLRTHTSPVQARAMLKKKGQPLQIICPGKVYRRDDDDPTHSHQFMQIEGLVIGEDISFANLKTILLKLVQHLFGKDRMIRLRPSYFPFTEPSVEVDVSFINKNNETEYIEILGAGQVHPNVLQMGGYDPTKYQGFAFGIGVERIAILKHHIDDIRHFYQNDIRFLKQFRGVDK